MTDTLTQFQENLTYVRGIGSVYRYLKPQMPPSPLDLSELLRAELVLAVSALDQYVHEIVKKGIIETYMGTRPKSTRYELFQISIDNSFDRLNTKWLEEEILEKHRWRSFQKAEKISGAIQLISDINLWEEIGIKMGDTATDIMTRLNAIVDRRNKIVHEADRDPSLSGTNRWTIQENEVDAAIDFLEKTVQTIDQIV